MTLGESNMTKSNMDYTLDSTLFQVIIHDQSRLMLLFRKHINKKKVLTSLDDLMLSKPMSNISG